MMVIHSDIAVHSGTRRRNGTPLVSARGWRHRTGAGLVIVMIGIFLVGVFAAAMLQAILQRHRAQKRELQELQCQFLLESGLERARAQLALDPEYAGEHWQLGPSLLEELSFDIATEVTEPRGSSEEITVEAEVVIEVRKNAVSDSGQNIVQVTAHYPFDPLVRIRTSQEFLVLLDTK